MNVRILIPEQIYVGARPDRSHAAVTAYGTDSSSKGRLSTVETFGGGAHNCVAVLNTPKTGFRLIKAAYKNEWWVQDPRGFEVLIKDHWITLLINNCVVINGAVQNPCVYARSGGDNVILPTTSAIYQHAVVATRVANKNTSWTKAHAGNHVVLQNGQTGVYLGKYYRIDSQHSRNYDEQESAASGIDVSDNLLLMDTTPVYALMEHAQNVSSSFTNSVHLFKSSKLAEINNADTLTDQEAELKTNQLIGDPQTYVARRMWSKPLLMLYNKQDMSAAQLVMNTVADTPSTVSAWIGQHLTSSSYGGEAIYAQLTSGEIMKLQVNRKGIQATHVSKQHLDQHQLRYIMTRTRGYRADYWVQATKNITTGDVAQLIDLHVQVVTALGNQLSVNVN